MFVTAYEHYAVQAFEHGAIDYLVKPFDEARLADTVARLKAAPGRARSRCRPDFEAVLERLAGELQARGGADAPQVPAMDPRLGRHRACG